VDVLDSTGADSDNLVNAIGHYSGTVPLNLDDSTTSSALKIQADGSWVATVKPVASAPRWSGSSTLRGKGDAVVVVVDAIDKSGLNTVTMTHSGQRNFIVDAVGDSDSNLVNEIGHYSGQQVLPTDTVLLVIQADGAWTVAKS
jgi:hypothetical protein